MRQIPYFHYIRTVNQKILIIDFGSQYTQLIARRIRELEVYSEIVSYLHVPAYDPSIKGVIFAGSPFSVMQISAVDLHMATRLEPSSQRRLGPRPTDHLA